MAAARCWHSRCTFSSIVRSTTNLGAGKQVAAAEGVVIEKTWNAAGTTQGTQVASKTPGQPRP